MTRMTDDERRERAKAMLEFPVARMCQEIGQEHNRRLQWDAWGAEWFLVRLDGERRGVEVPTDWLVDYPEASQGYQWSLQARIRDKVRRLCRQQQRRRNIPEAEAVPEERLFPPRPAYAPPRPRPRPMA